MSCSKFQILNLPYLAKQQVTEFMDPIDILDLSFCSKRAKECAMSHRVKRKYCNLFTRTTFNKHVGVEIVFSNDVKLSWMLVKQLKKFGNHEPVQPRKVGNVNFEASSKEMSSNTLHTSCDNLEASLKLVIDHILSLFPCPVQSLYLDMKFFSNIHSISNWNALKKCKSLTLKTDGFARQDVENVLNMIDGYESLNLLGYDKEVFFNEKMASLKQLKCVDAFFLSEQNIFKLNCETIELGENSYKPVLLNKIMKTWLAGKFDNLRTLTILMENIFENISDSQLLLIFSGVPLKVWDSKIRHRYYKKSSSTLYDCIHGCDILRDDGKLATVFFANYSFNFLIWDEKFPDFTLSPGMCYSMNPKQPILTMKKYNSTDVYIVDVNKTDNEEI